MLETMAGKTKERIISTWWMILILHACSIEDAQCARLLGRRCTKREAARSAWAKEDSPYLDMRPGGGAQLQQQRQPKKNEDEAKKRGRPEELDPSSPEAGRLG